ncbi:hypothetical protein [Nostocoides sp. HKS02]|uniref:hypothetical protein n=1 Tax=Nostocoides sp. HKS02 TaxID=1813880 RepID=UPI0012B4B3CD|nr:hypothetical protein [Tetrasphaera sp. HKS02]QGN58692.1 hypothetical protein GKE56_13315 [Tetrasphaera sp. HKS02]
MPDVPLPLAQAMQRLYAAGLDEFMAVRSELVARTRAEGERAMAADIGKLRKPSVAAWAVNLTARQSPEVVLALVRLGSRMRAAQGRLDTAALTALRPERDAVVRDFVEAAVRETESAGRSLGPGAREEVRATAVAALADEGAGAAVSSGQLTRALSYSGFGEVDLSEAVARTASGAILTLVPGARDEGDRAGETAGDTAGDAAGDTDQPSLGDLEQALEAADSQLAQAEQAVARARERAEETRERLAVVERQLAKAREADERALEEVTDAVRARKQAAAARSAAEQALASGSTLR